MAEDRGCSPPASINEGRAARSQDCGSAFGQGEMAASAGPARAPTLVESTVGRVALLFCALFLLLHAGSYLLVPMNLSPAPWQR